MIKLLPLGLAGLAIALWYFDGAWTNGEMPTHGALLVCAFGLASLIFFGLAKKFKR